MTLLNAKMTNCECHLALLCVLPYISICLLPEERAMIEICLSITAEKKTPEYEGSELEIRYPSSDLISEKPFQQHVH